MGWQPLALIAGSTAQEHVAFDFQHHVKGHVCVVLHFLQIADEFSQQEQALVIGTLKPRLSAMRATKRIRVLGRVQQL